MYDAEIKWDKNIVTVTLKHEGLKLSRMFDAEIANSMLISGAKYADLLFKDMLTEFRNGLHIHGVDY